MPFGIYVSNVTYVVHMNNLMSMNQPRNCFHVQVGLLVTKSECTVGECSDLSMSGCSQVALHMDLSGVDMC